MSRRSNCDIQVDSALGPENFMAATDSFLKVVLCATDNDSLTNKLYRDLQPQKVRVDVESVLSGVVITVDGLNLKYQPTIFISWAVKDQPPFIFSHWAYAVHPNCNAMQPRSPNARPFVRAVLFCIDSATVQYQARRKNVAVMGVSVAIALLRLTNSPKSISLMTLKFKFYRNTLEWATIGTRSIITKV
jgi:hypothetical protein